MSKSKKDSSPLFHNFSWFWVLFLALLGGFAGATASCAEWLKIDNSNESILLALTGIIAGVAGLLGTFIGIAYTFAIGSRDEGARVYRNAVGKELNSTFISMILGSFGSVFLVIASMIVMMFEMDTTTLSLIGMSVGALGGLGVQTILLIRVMSDLVHRSDMRESQHGSEQLFDSLAENLKKKEEEEDN